MRQGIAAYLANGAAMMQPYFLGLLADALDAGGRIEEGLDVLAGAQRLVEETGEHYYEAELFRLRGELLLKAADRVDHTDAAQTCFQQALAVARRQGALAWELRTTISAADWARRHGRHDRNRAGVRSILAPICDRFTEGFETCDWRTAAALCGNAD
jgi:predicted ATPase